MLTQDQKAFYAENGYLMVENAVTPKQLARLRDITARLIDASRSVTESNEIFDLDKGHGPDAPRLTRVKLPHKRDPYFWEALRNSAMTTPSSGQVSTSTASMPRLSISSSRPW